MGTAVWTRWKRLAHQAAVFQANALFLVLYFAAIVPMRWLRLGGERGGPAAAGRAPQWRPRETKRDDLASVRRQF
jgi:hypothetical protein